MPRCRACVQGVGGAVQYPKNYLKEAFELVRERGGLCIADEVFFLILMQPLFILLLMFAFIIIFKMTQAESREHVRVEIV